MYRKSGKIQFGEDSTDVSLFVRKIRSVIIAYFFGWVEQDAAALNDSVFSVIKELEQKVGLADTKIVAAGMATQRSNIVC